MEKNEGGGAMSSEINCNNYYSRWSKIIAVFFLCFSLSACGKFDRWLAGMTGDASKTCVDGVTYLQFTSGATMQVDRAGKPVGC